MNRSLVAAFVVLFVGCASEDPERIHVRLSMGLEEAGVGDESVGFAPPTTARGDGLTITLNRPVHWIEVERCVEECEPTPFHGYCYYGVSDLVWETAMGVNYAGKFDDVLRGTPEIVGPIVYGELPPNAGWQMDAIDLVEGERYAINVYEYEACDTADQSCVHDAAVGCRFFIIENGALVDITGASEPDD